MNRVVVFAYHDIGCIGIEALLTANYTIEAVFTHVDDPKENCFFRSVAQLCAQREIPVYAPKNVNQSLWIAHIQGLKPQFIFSFYYRKLLSDELLTIAPGGAFNLHGALLPRYRGCAPHYRVVVNGETETGITLHRMVKAVDAGNIVAQHVVPISYEDTSFNVHKKLCDASRTLLVEMLPRFVKGEIVETAQDISNTCIYGVWRENEAEINWQQSAQQLYNLIRAATKPYRGAFTFVDERKLIIWSARVMEQQIEQKPGTVLSLKPLQVICGSGILEIISGQEGDDGLYLSGSQLARQMNLYVGECLPSDSNRKAERRTVVLTLGVNSFIGTHLTQRLLLDGNYEVYGLDTNCESVQHFKEYPNFHFVEADIVVQSECLENYIKKCDIVLPCLAIETSAKYIQNPLDIFELTFEENLKIVRYCVKYSKRLIFPSSSLVYGLCDDEKFTESTSRLIVGPINKQCWIYSVSKQLLDRVIWAYGQNGFKFTLFRPFDWIGSYFEQQDPVLLDSSRLITDMLTSLVKGTPLKVVDGGVQKRCFTYIDDGIEALLQIIKNKNKCCDGQIINIGNPQNEASINEVAQELVRQFDAHPLRSYFPAFAGFIDVESSPDFSIKHQNVSHFKPNIANAKRLLNWTPEVSLSDIISKILDNYLQEAVKHSTNNGNKAL